MNKLMIVLLFIFSSYSLAEEECFVTPIVLPTIVIEVGVAASEKSCDKEFSDSYLDLVTGCLSGGFKAGASVVEGIVELTKLLLVEAPQWIWNETKKKIESIRAQNLSPFEMVEAISNIQVASHSEIFNKAQEYWKIFQKFSNQLKNSLVSEIKGFPCLPKFKQSEIICQGVSTVFLSVFTPAAFINGAKWTAASSRAVINFAKETKKINGLSDDDFATRLNRVTEYLKGGIAVKGGVNLAGGVLKEVELADGKTIFQFTKNVTGKDGKTHAVTREVPIDGKTKSIDANSDIGKEILTAMVSTQAGKGSLVFIDLNHLGKVNYFSGGTQTGDKYLASVSESLRKTLRPGDQIFKNGGDELVVVISNNDPKVVKAISQRMIQEVDSHPEIRTIFRREVKKVTDQYKELNNISSFKNLPSVVKLSLTPQEMASASRNFDQFKKDKLASLRGQMAEQASYRGSVSVGTSLIRKGDDLSSTLLRAEAQASRVKAEYKLRLGLDISKYNITPEEFRDIRKWSPPQAIDPN